jgi:hypothetical protein
MDPAGFAITLTFNPASHIAVYEWWAGGSLERISPLRQDPVDSLRLPTPNALPTASGRAGLEPRVVVTTPSGWEQPLGPAQAWSTARVLWVPQVQGPGRSHTARSPLWFVVSLPEPLTPALDSAAKALDLPCCMNASALVGKIAAAFGLPPARVWGLSTDRSVKLSTRSPAGFLR